MQCLRGSPRCLFSRILGLAPRQLGSVQPVAYRICSLSLISQCRLRRVGTSFSLFCPMFGTFGPLFGLFSPTFGFFCPMFGSLGPGICSVDQVKHSAELFGLFVRSFGRTFG